MKTKTHWVSAKELAKNYLPDHSTVFANDHIEALLDERKFMKPESWSVEKWELHKENTSSLNIILERIRVIGSALRKEEELV